MYRLFQKRIIKFSCLFSTSPNSQNRYTTLNFGLTEMDSLVPNTENLSKISQYNNSPFYHQSKSIYIGNSHVNPDVIFLGNREHKHEIPKQFPTRWNHINLLMLQFASGDQSKFSQRRPPLQHRAIQQATL